MNLLSTSEALQQINERLSNPVSRALFHQSIVPLMTQHGDAQVVGNSLAIDGATLPAWISYLCWREQQIASGAMHAKAPYSLSDMEALFLGEYDND